MQNYEKSGYDLNLDLLTILYQSQFTYAQLTILYPRRSGVTTKHDHSNPSNLQKVASLQIGVGSLKYIVDPKIKNKKWQH